MARCQLTGKRRLKAMNVSHAHNRTGRWQHPNIQSKRIYVEELGRHVRLSLSTRAMRTITKVGLVAYARKTGIDLASLLD
ncbi:MAG: 50S ribosomal protein L28 [Myxococcota bacterium]|jgi:large subunit ribosomal protein L28|nr:50S ribosomal protein L28 [Myxococcota bacterium]HHW96331.1 50S ribosomal protein L28 [Oligoflexales bacterium]MBP8970240.1 50S ribosomal protein L28 [Myxococcota bacterium]HOE82444.1 50S ribosomal protein L28 [Myxococcota bacterium]HOS61764.1 50S ribosomal protein L28 [Myxococcota bacterium]